MIDDQVPDAAIQARLQSEGLPAIRREELFINTKVMVPLMEVLITIAKENFIQRLLRFHALAARIVTELLPPIEMSGCTARILDLAARVPAPPPLAD